MKNEFDGFLSVGEDEEHLVPVGLAQIDELMIRKNPEFALIPFLDRMMLATCQIVEELSVSTRFADESFKRFIVDTSKAMREARRKMGWTPARMAHYLEMRPRHYRSLERWALGKKR